MKFIKLYKTINLNSEKEKTKYLNVRYVLLNS